MICTWVLQAPVNHTVKLLIEEFYLEKDKKCFYDFMEFFDGGNAIEDLQMNKRFCGKQRPFIDYESTGRNLTIQFTSDKDKTYKGFLAVWEPSSGGSQHGGICHGDDKEIKKCSKKSRVKSKHPVLIDNAVIFRKIHQKIQNI